MLLFGPIFRFARICIGSLIDRLFLHHCCSRSIISPLAPQRRLSPIACTRNTHHWSRCSCASLGRSSGLWTPTPISRCAPSRTSRTSTRERATTAGSPSSAAERSSSSPRSSSILACRASRPRCAHVHQPSARIALRRGLDPLHPRLGDKVGRSLALESVMRWTPAVSDGQMGPRETGLFKVRGVAVEAIVGAIYHQNVPWRRRASSTRQCCPNCSRTASPHPCHKNSKTASSPTSRDRRRHLHSYIPFSDASCTSMQNPTTIFSFPLSSDSNASFWTIAWSGNLRFAHALRLSGLVLAWAGVVACC